MASIKSSRTWADIQESLSRVRQQYGLLPRAEWDDLIAVTSYEKAMSAKHKNRSLPRPFLPSLTSKSNWDLRKLDLEYVDTKRRKQHEGRRSAKYDSSYHKPLLLKNNEHERTKPTLEHNAYRYITENKRFAQDFVDSLISEILMDEIIPDVLIEALTSTQMSKKKYNGKKTRHWKSDDYGRSAGSLSMSILDELLIEILRDLSAHVLRRMVRGFVDDHLVRAAVHDCVDEILTNIIQTELLSLVDELNTEREHDRLLDNLIQSVIDKEVKDAVFSVLTECDSQLSEFHKDQIIVTANKHVVDIFLLEHLLGMIGTHEPLVFGKDPMQCLLDSIMLDVLLREQVSIQQVQQNTLETYPAMLSHQNTVSKVALEVILTELHMILVEDMEDIFEYERDVEL
ncbi:uncharacterized protein LOC130294081 isoform X1 [Hyla sarda]|uniref:uncharacterized protein LOC130294081 isoform X1 n=1 Tax=Hyla sarda TaxID=327740 RepID=UPI0024C3C886|nr:uncharacterized protein LOC130294081 isoform X1 [Hyla sarda]XP_056399475.1 uncharacterized protein LOC130294081 isoform X1 [Hyla sarda]